MATTENPIANKVKLKDTKTNSIIYPASSSSVIYREKLRPDGSHQTVEEALNNLEVNGTGGGNGGFIVSNTEPQDHNKLWIDPDDTTNDKEVLLNQNNSVKHNNIANGAVYGNKMLTAGAELGGVKADRATPEMTEPVGIGEDGKLRILGNIKIKRLWTNASPNSSFSDVTIECDLRPYELFILGFKHEAKGNDQIEFFIYKKGFNRMITHSGHMFSTGANVLFSGRQFSIGDGGVSFRSGIKKYHTMDSTTVDNGFAVPVYIYGISGVK